MSLLNDTEVDEVIDNYYYDPRPCRGEGLDIRLDKSTNNEDIVFSCKVRIPKEYSKDLSSYDEPYDLYTKKSENITFGEEEYKKYYLKCVLTNNSGEKLNLLGLPYKKNILFNNIFKGSDNIHPLFSKLHVNINNDIIIDDLLWKSTWELIDDILAEGDFHYTKLMPFILKDKTELLNKDNFGLLLTERDITLWLSFLKSSIPVRLVDEEQMPNLQVHVEFPENKTPENVANKDDELTTKLIDGDFRYMEALGLYLSNESEPKRKILLCPKRIKETADKLKIPFEYLVAIVYIHELGHAALDETIDLDEIANRSEVIKIKINGQKIDTNKDKFSFVMEESLANMIMLQYIAWYAESKIGYDYLFETAKLFVEEQSPAYAFGLYQFNADVDWLCWRNYKANIYKQESKTIIGDKQKSEWYDLFENIMNSDIYRKSFDQLFK